MSAKYRLDFHSTDCPSIYYSINTDVTMIRVVSYITKTRKKYHCSQFKCII